MGQAQAGVDVYAVPVGEDQYWGIQCKGKDDYTNAKLTTKEVDEEIDKALVFSPKLKVFILATTATKDVAIEEYVRRKDVASRAAHGPEILLYCWEDIADLIEENRETFNWYVNEHQFRTQFDFTVSFADGNKELVLRPIFIKKIRIFRYKKPTPAPTGKKEIFVAINGVPVVRTGVYPDLEPDPSLERFANSSVGKMLRRQEQMQRSILGPLANQDLDRVNYAFKKFTINFTNTGSHVIEDWRLKFELQGEFRGLTDIVGSGPMGLVLPSAYQNSPTFCEDKSIYYRRSFSSTLVQGDSRSFDAYVIPRPELYRIPIKWELLARDYKTEGELFLIVEPEFEREFERYVDENQEGRRAEIISIKEKGGKYDSPNYADNKRLDQ